MEKENKKLKNILDRSKKILILSHKGPDLDAFCSMLITQQILKSIYPKKEIVIQARQNPSTNLPCMKEIKIQESLNSDTFDSIIVTDAGDMNICIDKEKDNVNYDDIPVVLIDHHDTIVNQLENILLINHNASSATEEVYMTFKDIFGRKLKLTKDIAELIQYGIVADTGRFLYDITTTNSLRIFADAKEISPVDLEEFSYKNDKFPKQATDAVIEYLKTLTIAGDMAYMYMDRKTIEDNPSLRQGVSEAQSFLRDKYLRFIQGVHWGFIIKPDINSIDNWFISFRSTKGYQDVKVIAEELGGGGHIYSAGVPFKANSLQEVIDATLKAVEKHIPS